MKSDRIGNQIQDVAAAVNTADNGVAFAHIYHAYWSDICRYVAKTFGVGPPDPEDVAQTAFSNFYAQENREHIKNPRAFLYRTAHNVVVSYYRKATTRRQYLAEQAASSSEDTQDNIHPERILMSREKLDLLERIMWDMPVQRRRMLIMSRFDEMSYAEISRKTGISQTVVRKHVTNALADFQKALSASEDKKD